MPGPAVDLVDEPGFPWGLPHDEDRVDLCGHVPVSQRSAPLDRVGRGFERQLSELRTRILDVRMVPLGQVFGKFGRIVRQAAREHDKQVRLVVTGANTEMDKLIVEVSLLTPPEKLKSTKITQMLDDIQVGRDGLIIERDPISTL